MMADEERIRKEKEIWREGKKEEREREIESENLRKYPNGMEFKRVVCVRKSFSRDVYRYSSFPSTFSCPLFHPE